MRSDLNTLRLDLGAGERAVLYHVGAGPIVLYVHGWAHASSRWKRFQLSTTTPFTHVAIDLPGFGALSDTSVRRPYLASYAAYLCRVCEALTKHFGEPLEAVVSHSLGACAAVLAFQSSIPDELCPKKLVLLDAPLLGICLLKPAVLFYPLLLMWFQLRFVVPSWLARFAIKFTGLLTTYKWSAMDRAFVADGMAPRSTILIQTLFAIAFTNISLNRIPRAKLFMSRGRWDWITTAQQMQRSAAAWSATTHTFDCAGHTPFMETPEAFREWLEGILMNTTNAKEST